MEENKTNYERRTRASERARSHAIHWQSSTIHGDMIVVRCSLAAVCIGIPSGVNDERRDRNLCTTEKRKKNARPRELKFSSFPQAAKNDRKNLEVGVRIPCDVRVSVHMLIFCFGNKHGIVDVVVIAGESFLPSWPVSFNGL